MLLWHAARLAVDTWSSMGGSASASWDVRLVIAKLIWNARGEAACACFFAA
jgi:hypothetical protein